jgi:hypothetical protein
MTGHMHGVSTYTRCATFMNGILPGADAAVASESRLGLRLDRTPMTTRDAVMRHQWAAVTKNLTMLRVWPTLYTIRGAIDDGVVYGTKRQATHRVNVRLSLRWSLARGNEVPTGTSRRHCLQTRLYIASWATVRSRQCGGVTRGHRRWRGRGYASGSAGHNATGVGYVTQMRGRSGHNGRGPPAGTGEPLPCPAYFQYDWRWCEHPLSDHQSH